MMGYCQDWFLIGKNMNRNIIFRFTFIFALAALFTLFTVGCMTSKNLSKSIKDGSLQTGQQMTNKVQESTGVLQDASITSAIKIRFANDEGVSASNINVDTSHRSVTLMGSVNSQAVADRALHLGRSVDGVKSVHSFLVVRGRK
jgi:hyperosmotically inducible periplasmic protein